MYQVALNNVQWFIRNRDERASGIWLYKQFTDLFTLTQGKERVTELYDITQKYICQKMRVVGGSFDW